MRLKSTEVLWLVLLPVAAVSVILGTKYEIGWLEAIGYFSSATLVPLTWYVVRDGFTVLDRIVRREPIEDRPVESRER